jgi:hypothetical protein
MAHTHITQEGKPIKMSDRTKATLDHVESCNRNQKKRIKHDRDNIIEEKTDSELYNIRSNNTQ